MQYNGKGKEYKIWRVLAVIIVAVWLISIGMLVNSHSNNKKLFLDGELKHFEGEVNSTLITYEAFSNYIFDEINDDEEVISILYEANTATEKEKEILRDDLFNKLSDKYLRMKKYEFRQLHFHLPNTESFLRVHSPNKYGDLLADIRESVRLVNESKKKVSGFEEGRIFNGFRHVYPLAYKEEHIGSVEISISSASVIEVFSKLYSNKDFHFIIDKTAVDNNVFDEEMKNYRNAVIFEDYYVDKEVEAITIAYNKVLFEDKELFFAGVKEKYKEDLKEKRSFAGNYKFNGQDYIVRFLAIKNLKASPVAYLISVSESVGYKQFTKDMYEEIILITFLAFFIIIFGLVLAYYQNKLKDNAELDYLTKIYNRNKFYEIAEREVKAAKRYKHVMSVMLLDIDCFKKINDTYGHEWGDKVLKELAKTISQNIRDTDVFARWGGEEFVLLLPNTNQEEALIVGEKVRKLMEDSEVDELTGITISVGITVLDTENYDIDRAVKVADEAMYSAKSEGRNRVRFK